MGDKAVRQPRTPKSRKIDMSRAVRPYIFVCCYGWCRSCKTIDGLLKLLCPDAEVPIPDEDLEWAVRITLECRRCVKKQQRRIGAAVAVGNLSFGGSAETVLNAAALAEHAMEKGATGLLLPVSARRQLLDVSDEVATKVSFLFHSDAQDALVKALAE